MLAKLTYKNQITIPKIVIQAFGAVEYFEVERRNEEIVLKPVLVSSKNSELQKIRDKMKSLGITQSDIEEAVRWARKEKR